MQLSNKTIHDDLVQLSGDYPEYSNKDTEVVYRNNTFKLRCVPSSGAILNIAKKFKSQKNFTTPQRSYGTKPRSSSLVYNEMIRDKEYQEAIDFWLLKHDVIYFGVNGKLETSPLPQGNEFITGFICHKDTDREGYNVTHLLSGRTCGSNAPTQAKAIAKFKAIPAERLERAMKALGDTDYQIEAKKTWLL